MIDHTSITVSDHARSTAFYTQALAAIGYQPLMEFGDAAGFGEPPKPDFWIVAGPPAPVHVAFRVRTRAEVHAFHAAALAAGGTDNGAPGLRPHYHATYYAAFVIDPDGHNIEAVCHSPE
ncbi:VOC family protein [soil metagenome]